MQRLAAGMGGRQDPLFDAVGHQLAVGDQAALRVEQPGALGLGVSQHLKGQAGVVGIHRRLRLTDREGLVDDGSHQLALSGEAIYPRIDQTLAQLVEHQGAHDQHRQSENVQRDDQPAEP